METPAPHRPVGRSLGDFEPRTAAEAALLAACARGERHLVGGREPKAPPEHPSDANRIRAGFLRFLLLGGDAESPVHEHGVQIVGASITGELDLAGSETVCGLYARFCRFEWALKLVDCRLRGPLHLPRSRFPGVAGDRLRLDADMNLVSAAIAQRIHLRGAKIGGNLELNDANLNGKHAAAFSADGAEITGGVFLRRGCTVVAVRCPRSARRTW